MAEMLPFTSKPRRVRLRVEDFLTLDRAGAFAGYGKTELLDGEIVYVNAQHRPHGRVKMGLYDALRDALRRTGSPLAVLVEVSIALTGHDSPEPDLTLTSEPDGEGLIPAGSVALIVEVADTTLRSDLVGKAAIYARAGVAEYWVADVAGRRIHQHWKPIDSAFSERRQIPFGEPVIAATIDGLTIDTAAL